MKLPQSLSAPLGWQKPSLHSVSWPGTDGRIVTILLVLPKVPSPAGGALLPAEPAPGIAPPGATLGAVLPRPPEPIASPAEHAASVPITPITTNPRITASETQERY